MPALRRRYDYPCADLVTTIPAVDALLDAVLLHLGVNPGRPTLVAADPARTLAVIGFPRSGNTYLTHWLAWHAYPEVVVLDGRLTHSALDVLRLARSGATVVAPVRDPLATCASWMVRANAYADVDFARRTLRSYTAWYRTVARVADRHPVVIAEFRDFTKDPSHLAWRPALADLVDATRLSTLEEFETRLREDLDELPAQGAGLDGVPGHQMLSLPHEDRRELNEMALDILQRVEVADDLRAAEVAYLRLGDPLPLGEPDRHEYQER